MELKNEKAWQEWKANNKDFDDRGCIKVAEKAMEILDKNEPFETSALISQAEAESNAGGITGFMAGRVAQMITIHHERGKEFQKKWNKDYGLEEETEGDGVVNPALATIKI